MGTLQGIWKDLYTNNYDLVKSKFTLLYILQHGKIGFNKTIQQQIDYADTVFTDWKYDAQQVRIPDSAYNVKEPWKTYFDI